MEANKEQSERCVEIAYSSIRSGDKEKAMRFLQKALRLWSGNKKAEDLLDDLENSENVQNSSSANGDDFYCSNESGENRARSRFSSSKSQPTFSKNNSAHSGNSSTNNNNNNNNNNTKRPDSPENKARDSSSSKAKHARNRKRTSSSSPAPPHHKSASQPQLGVDYTQEQLDMVQRVRRCKDYYEILNVSKEFNEIELKRQYRKLALQFHPDKNNAPGATEAFKAIGNAYAVLSDSKKRERYDMYGSADSSHSSTQHHHRNAYYEYDYSRGFEADMTAEEIFNMFFGGGFPQNNLRRRQPNGFYQQSAENDRRNDSGFGVILQLMPILILVLLSIFSQLMVPDPPFSLAKSQKFNQERQTEELKVTYYVKTDFLKNYHNKIKEVDRQVEEEYIENLRSGCFRERNHKDTMLWRAKLYGDAHLYEKAQQLPTPSCARLSSIYK